MPEVVVHVDPNPKRPGTGAHTRYAAYALGRTREDLLAAGLTKRDLSWDEGQGHVRFGDGVRSTEPAPTAVPAAPVAAAPRRRGAVSAPAVQEPTPTSSGPALKTPLFVGPGRYVGELAARREGYAPWLLAVEAVEASAPAYDPGLGNGGRTWLVRATARGRAFKTEVRGDYAAASLVDRVARCGLDPDDWSAAS